MRQQRYEEALKRIVDLVEKGFVEGAAPASRLTKLRGYVRVLTKIRNEAQEALTRDHK